MARQRTKFTKGVVLIELLVAFGLAELLLPALLAGFVSATQGREVYEQRVAATALVREAEEAIRSFRNEAWSNISNLSTSPNLICLDQSKDCYYPSISGSKWTFLPGDESIPNTNFTRTVVVSDVYRDASQNIVAQGFPGASLDPSTRQFLITVSWPGYFTRSITSSLYITRYGNTSLSEIDKEVSAPAGGFGDWCKPVGPSVTNVDLDRKGHPTTIMAFESLDGTGNRTLAGTGASADGPGFTNINIVGNSPPAATPLGDYNGTPQVKVNGLFGDTHYVFLAGNNPLGVVILDISTTPYQQIGSFNPSNKNVNDVYVVGDTGYAVTTDEFYIFNISSDRKTTTQIGGPLSLANGARVVVDASNQYAYVPNTDSSGELKIIDVHSHQTNLTSADVKNVDVDGGAGRDVFINAGANRAYLATAISATQPEFFIIDITDKGNPTIMPQGTYDTDGMDPYGIAIVSGPRAIIVGTGGHEYQVFSIEGDKVSFCPNHATGDDFLNIDTGVFAVSSVLQKTDQYAYSYIATGDPIAEIKIIEGGPGTGGVGGNGTYESPTLPVPDPGHDVAFNSFSATSDPNLSYKISIKHGASGSCSLITFSDSDFTSFIPGSLPLTTIGSGYVNPGECLRYRAINSGSSPITFTATFNYSP